MYRDVECPENRGEYCFRVVKYVIISATWRVLPEDNRKRAFLGGYERRGEGVKKGISPPQFFYQN